MVFASVTISMPAVTVIVFPALGIESVATLKTELFSRLTVAAPLKVRLPVLSEPLPLFPTATTLAARSATVTLPTAPVRPGAFLIPQLKSGDAAFESADHQCRLSKPLPDFQLS